MTGPSIRPRRLRANPAMRRLVAETRLHPAELVLPMFVREGVREPVPISSMPGVVNHSLDSLRRAAVEAAEAGVGGVMLFGIPAYKDAIGSGATADDGILNVATRAVVAEVGDALVVQTDLCLDEYTDHGHCGVLAADGSVDNDASLLRYRDMGVAQAAAGSQLLGLSGMMDGQVAAVRDALDSNDFAGTAILGYAAKYASAFYGPFREVAESEPSFGDRRGYQLDPPNVREALRECALDLEEGADALMVKPALAYLDVIRAVRERFDCPVAAYNVSGEYAMVKAAAAAGHLDEKAATLESLVAIKRAGADLIFTYWAKDLARWL